MKQIRQIVFKEADWHRLTAYLTENPNAESGAYAVFRISGGARWQKYLVNTVLLPSDADYHKRTATAVAFTPEFTEAAFQTCERLQGNLLDIHTHPWADRVSFSAIDDHEALSKKVPYVTKYLTGLKLAFIVLGTLPEIARARIWDKAESRLVSIDRILVI